MQSICIPNLIMSIFMRHKTLRVWRRVRIEPEEPASSGFVGFSKRASAHFWQRSPLSPFLHANHVLPFFVTHIPDGTRILWPFKMSFTANVQGTRALSIFRRLQALAVSSDRLSCESLCVKTRSISAALHWRIEKPTWHCTVTPCSTHCKSPPLWLKMPHLWKGFVGVYPSPL